MSWFGWIRSRFRCRSQSTKPQLILRRQTWSLAEATVRSQLGQTRGLRFKLQHAIEDVDNQIALIRARVATWEQSKATQVLAEQEFERGKKLLQTKVSSEEEFDTRRKELDVANA